MSQLSIPMSGTIRTAFIAMFLVGLLTERVDVNKREGSAKSGDG